MKPHTDSRAPPEDAHTAAQLGQAAATAAALIELAIRDSLTPVEALGRALTRIGMVTESGREVRVELAVCVESLQFHDRMVQQLTQIRDLLACAAARRTDTDVSESLGWPALRERLRARFTSDSHRMLFNLLLPGEDEDTPLHLHADQGSVELF